MSIVCLRRGALSLKFLLALLVLSVLPVSESLAQWNITSYRAAKVQLYTDHLGRNPVLTVDRALAPKFATEQDPTTRFFRVAFQGRHYWIDADTVTAQRVSAPCPNKSDGTAPGAPSANSQPDC
jgi:hypothetical protein